MITEKIDDYTIQVTKDVVVPLPVVNTYDLKFLYNQRDRITADAADYAAKRQAELDEVNALITEAEKLGIVEKPVEVIQDAAAK